MGIQMIKPWMNPFFTSLGFHCYENAETEADDIMASVSKYAVDHGICDCVVHVSPDKDMLQLIQDATAPITAPITAPVTAAVTAAVGVGATHPHTVIPVYVMDKMETAYTVITGQEVEQKYQLKPNQLCDYFALTGDSADNIPGLKHIGHKGAVSIIQYYHSIEKFYNSVCKNGNSADVFELSKCFTATNTRIPVRRLATVMDATPLQDILLFKHLVTLNSKVTPVWDSLQAQRSVDKSNLFKLSNKHMKSVLLQAQTDKKLHMCIHPPHLSSSSSNTNTPLMMDSIDITRSFDMLHNMQILYNYNV